MITYEYKMSIYNRIGQIWTSEEDEILYKLYHVDKLTIGDICKKQGRTLEAIKCRFIDKGIIKGMNKVNACSLIRGYGDFVTSKDYEQMKIEIKKYYDVRYNRNKNKGVDDTQTTITREEYCNLNQEIVTIKEQLYELKDMIQSLAIYKVRKKKL